MQVCGIIGLYGWCGGVVWLCHSGLALSQCLAHLHSGLALSQWSGCHSGLNLSQGQAGNKVLCKYFEPCDVKLFSCRLVYMYLRFHFFHCCIDRRSVIAMGTNLHLLQSCSFFVLCNGLQFCVRVCLYLRQYSDISLCKLGWEVQRLKSGTPWNKWTNVRQERPVMNCVETRCYESDLTEHRRGVTKSLWKKLQGCNVFSFLLSFCFLILTGPLRRMLVKSGCFSVYLLTYDMTVPIHMCDDCLANQFLFCYCLCVW